jgi:CheY-like chemotaxis protein
LPERAGWIILDRLKHDLETRHLPVYTVSQAQDRDRALRLGALGHLSDHTPGAAAVAVADIRAFVERGAKTLLLIEDDPTQQMGLTELLSGEGVQITSVGTGQEALAALESTKFDCVVLDLGLPDVPGLTLVETIRKERGLTTLPIIVNTGRDLSRAQEIELRRITEAIVVKDARSPERLLEEVSIFLHRAPSALPEPKRVLLERARERDPQLLGRRVLVVDDDVRNIFALSTVLERYGLNVDFAESAKEGIEILDRADNIDLVLMDVMMPEMDGYQAMRSIRANSRFGSLPILALTAKAMKGDRQKCIAAGASDYITKPVDIDKLLSLMRVWMH